MRKVISELYQNYCHNHHHHHHCPLFQWQDTVSKWQRCADELSYSAEIQSTVEYHVNLRKKRLSISHIQVTTPFYCFCWVSRNSSFSCIYSSMVFGNSGDHDFMVSFISTQSWIRSLNYSIVDDWRPWMVEGQVGGYAPDLKGKLYLTPLV